MISTAIGNSPNETDYKSSFNKFCGSNNIPSGCAMMAIQFNGGSVFDLSPFSFRPDSIAFNDTLNNKKVLKMATMTPPTLLIQVKIYTLYNFRVLFIIMNNV